MLLTPEDGSAPFYAIMEMADDPIDIGTPPTKENLLTDDTEAALFGSTADRTVNQALSYIAGRLALISGNLAEIDLTVVTTNGNPVPNMPIDGAFDANGNTLVTNAAGKAAGYVSEGNITLSVSGYADVQNYSETMEIAKGQSYKKTITLSTVNFVKLTSSKSVRFSPNVSRVDVTVVGGGGSGGTGDGSNQIGAAGGGGGECVVEENLPFVAGQAYVASIGAGGKGVKAYDPKNGTDGGDTTFMGLRAVGGKAGTGGFSSTNAGGTGNGAGGKGVSGSGTPGAGSPGSVLGYASFTELCRYGGGGGGARGGGNTGAVGGADFGASGAGVKDRRTLDGESAADGTGGGGGGGSGQKTYSGDSTDTAYGTGGDGGSGCVSIRIHLKAA